MTGQALGGLIVALLNVLTLAVGGKKNNATNAAFIFFIIAVALIVVCLGAFLYMITHPYVRLMERRNALARQNSITSIESMGGDTSLWAQAKSAINQVKLPAFMVMMVFTVTLAVFPGIAVFCACVLLRLLQPWRHSRKVHVAVVPLAWQGALQEAPGACDDSPRVYRSVCVPQRGAEQHG